MNVDSLWISSAPKPPFAHTHWPQSANALDGACPGEASAHPWCGKRFDEISAAGLSSSARPCPNTDIDTGALGGDSWELKQPAEDAHAGHQMRLRVLREFTVLNFPLKAANQILPRKFQDPAQEVWVAITMMKEVVRMPRPLLEKSGFCCTGASRALRTASEKVIRTVAIIMPSLEVLWSVRQGMDGLRVRFEHVLFDCDGELHPPKDGDRREMALTPELAGAGGLCDAKFSRTCAARWRTDERLSHRAFFGSLEGRLTQASSLEDRLNKGWQGAQPAANGSSAEQLCLI
ncbi:MAG: hypothetical protein SGPRY_000954 [Prymnesium sp.]